jgi:hypothetical protein
MTFYIDDLAERGAILSFLGSRMDEFCTCCGELGRDALPGHAPDCLRMKLYDLLARILAGDHIASRAEEKKSSASITG